MYHSVIGKRLVAAVKRRDGSDWDVRGFFNEVYVPLFYSSPRMLQNVGNSPFFQEFVVQRKSYSDGLRDACLAQVHAKVRDRAPDASFFLGGPAAGATDTTSGQVTSMPLPVTHEDVYASWIGAAAGLTVEGGLTLLIDADDVLTAVYDGWREYRRYLDQTPGVKPLQVNTWNGQWVTHRLSGRPGPFQPSVDKAGAKLETQPWVRLLFALSYHFCHRADAAGQALLAYVYSLGQMNTTVGFLRLNLPEVRRPVDLYSRLFTVPPGLPPAAFEDLYQTEVSFRAACLSTDVGLRALKPRDIFHAERSVPKPPGDGHPEKQLAFQIYQTWIIAMLNNKELLDRAQELAEALKRFRDSEERGKTRRPEMVRDLLEKRNRREFIEALTRLVEMDSCDLPLFEKTVDELISLSSDSVPLFLTLVRFKYAAATARR
jgi:hypothetical protein